MEKITPQQRWQNFKEHLPKLTIWQRRLTWSLAITILLIFTLMILPYWLPLAGEEQSPQDLADSSGSFTSVDGVSMYSVHFLAETSKETVLLIHGQTGATVTWNDIYQPLQDAGYNIYAIDLVGLGLSEKGENLDYSHPAHAIRILKWMDLNNIEDAHIVAHAFSSNIAVHMYHQAPERFLSLTMIAPTLFTEAQPALPEVLIEADFLQRWTQVVVRFVLPDTVGQFLRSAVQDDDIVNNDLITDYQRVMKTSDWVLSIWGTIRDSNENSLQAPIDTIDVPTLLMWGDADGWAPIDSADGLLNDIESSCLFSFPDVGHLPMHETPETFSETLIAFWQKGCENVNVQDKVLE